MSRVVLWPRHEVLQLVLPVFGNCGRTISNKIVVEAASRLFKQESADELTSFDQWLRLAKDILKWNDSTGQLFWDILMAAVWYKTEKSLVVSMTETRTDYIILFLSLHTVETPTKSPILSHYDSVWPGQAPGAEGPGFGGSPGASSPGSMGMGSPSKAMSTVSSSNNSAGPVASSAGPGPTGAGIGGPPLSPTQSPPGAAASSFFTAAGAGGTGGAVANSTPPALPSSPRSPAHHGHHGQHQHGSGYNMTSSPGKPGPGGGAGSPVKAGLSAYARPTAAQHLNTIRVRLPLILRALSLRYLHGPTADSVPTLASDGPLASSSSSSRSSSGGSTGSDGNNINEDDEDAPGGTATSSGSHPASGLSISASVFAAEAVLTKRDVDCLGLLVGGGKHRDDEATYISSLHPFFAGMPGSGNSKSGSSTPGSVHSYGGASSPSPPTCMSQSLASVHCNDLLSWLEANLCVNESVYPSSASTSTVSKASLAAATSLLDTGKDAASGVEAAVGAAPTTPGGTTAAGASMSLGSPGAGGSGSGNGSSSPSAPGSSSNSGTSTSVLISSKVITHSGPIRIIYPVTYLSSARPTVISGASSVIMHVMATPTNCGRYRSRSISAGMYGPAGLIGGGSGVSGVGGSALQAAQSFNSTAFQESLTAAVRSTGDLSLEDDAAARMLKVAEGKEGADGGSQGRGGAGGWVPAGANASFPSSAVGASGSTGGAGSNITVSSTPFNRTFSDHDNSKAEDFMSRVANSNRLTTEALPHLVLQNSVKTSIYVLSPYATGSILHCSDCDIITGPIAGVLIVADCERVRISSLARKIILRNCLDCVVSCGTLSPVIVAGDSRGLVLGPFNTCYKDLSAHVELAGLSGLLLSKHRKQSRSSSFDGTVGGGGAGGGSAGSSNDGGDGGGAMDDLLDSIPIVGEGRSVSAASDAQGGNARASSGGGAGKTPPASNMWWCLWDVSQCITGSGGGNTNTNGGGAGGLTASSSGIFESLVATVVEGSTPSTSGPNASSLPPPPYTTAAGHLIGMPSPAESVACLQRPEKFRFVSIPEQSQCQSIESCPVDVPKAYLRSYSNNKTASTALAGKILGEMSVPPPPPPAGGAPGTPPHSSAAVSSSGSSDGSTSPQSSARATGRPMPMSSSPREGESDGQTDGGIRRGDSVGSTGSAGDSVDEDDAALSSSLGHMMLSGKFMEWLLTTGKASQIIELIRLDHQLQLQQQQQQQHQQQMPGSAPLSHSNSLSNSAMEAALGMAAADEKMMLSGNGRDAKGAAGGGGGGGGGGEHKEHRVAAAKEAKEAKK